MDLPSEGAGDVDLKAPITSYGSRGSHVARRKERNIGPWSSKNSPQIYPVLSRTRANFLKPPQRIVALVLRVDFLGEYCVAEATKPPRARDASVGGRRKSFAFVPRKLTL